MRASLALLLALAACAPAPRTAGTPPGTFGAQAWLARARAQPGDDVSDIDSPRLASIRTLSAELDAATGWDRACDTSWNRETGGLDIEENGAAYLRGLYTVYPFGVNQALVAVQCDYGAHSGRYAYVHIDGQRAALLKGRMADREGLTASPSLAVHYAMPEVAGDGTFTVFEASRGTGGCGSLARYRVAGLGEADLMQVRGLTCDAADAGDVSTEPSSWPVVFSTEPSSWPVVHPRP